ncbi:MAG TPA: hypothetical protein VFP98_01785, partial [Candidatus Polarisedimenticolia bacterium]|nr:hypothetical protein [Candidatus Polarisedimenticolia bacterium]
MKRWQIAALAGAAATLSCFLAVAWTNDKERSLRREELEREAGIVASQLTGRVLGGLQQHAIAIRQLAAFFEHSDDVTEREFHDFAASTSKLTPLCSRIPVLGP